ncbi:arylesterase [Confluentibacter flavum]|uniref:Arylesterase n=1 Tax=Confluentibacter flavum TaxID=1909700 RepID=A0A2N3HFT2_9FLAO|nr:arylesterase [Confluentibacter flavum]PKQ43830.1 arylesterase [Confluentibacter flavum]
MRILLMFCYILLLITSTSCRETSDKKTSTSIEDIEAEDNMQATTSKDKVILFFGNSLTAGMGLDVEEAFPAVIEQKLDSLGLSYKVINAGLSGETTASGKNRVEWILNQKVAVFVLELGANDGLRGIPPSETKSNLQAIIDVVREKNPETEIILAGMQMPPNLGEDYTTEFKNIFPELAEKNNIELIPFLLENVAGIPELNQGDGIHPTVEGQKIMAENVWVVLKDIL